MKGLLKTFAMVGLLAGLGACSAHTTIAERDTYASNPWYAKCAQAGSEGWLWWKKDYVYAVDRDKAYTPASLRRTDVCYCNEQLCKTYSNGRVNSETTLEFNNDSEKLTPLPAHKVNDTRVSPTFEEERGTYILRRQHLHICKT